MTATLEADPRAADRPAPSGERPGAADDPGARGRLVIADRVVEKVAARAADEVDLTTGAPRRVLGARLPAQDPPVRADVRIDGDLVSVTVTLAVRWPSPVRQVAEQVRQHLTTQVGRLTGLQVAEVDVEVTSLVTGHRPAPRVR